jgi:hypothetical protein
MTAAEELRAMARRARRLAPKQVTYADPVKAGYWCGLRDAAALMEKRAKKMQRGLCAAHKKPRRRYAVARCEHCGMNIEKEGGR